MSRSREERKEHLDHFPALIGLFDTVSGEDAADVRECLHHPLTVLPDVSDRRPCLLLDGSLDTRDLLWGERFRGSLDSLRRLPAGHRQSHRNAEGEEDCGNSFQGQRSDALTRRRGADDSCSLAWSTCSRDLGLSYLDCRRLLNK
jgi:hypothetical protein